MGLTRRDLFASGGALALGRALPQDMPAFTAADAISMSQGLFDALAYAALRARLEAIQKNMATHDDLLRRVSARLSLQIEANPQAGLASVVVECVRKASESAATVNRTLKERSEDQTYPIANPVDDDLVYQATQAYNAFLETAAQILTKTPVGAHMAADARAMRQAAIASRSVQNAFKQDFGRWRALILSSRSQLFEAIRLLSVTTVSQPAATALSVAIQAVERVEVANDADSKAAKVAVLDFLQAMRQVAERGVPNDLWASSLAGADLGSQVWQVLRDISENASNIHRSYFVFLVTVSRVAGDRTRRQAVFSQHIRTAVPKLKMVSLTAADDGGRRLASLT